MRSAAAWLTIWAALLCALPWAPAASAQAQPARRVAVLVGANAAPAGRRELRYARSDAQRLAEALQSVGRFAREDVHVLLEPSPAALLGVLEGLSVELQDRKDSLLLFYYSGHSDGQALYPSGESLLLSDLRASLERIRARVRVGILDTCRGGSWTQAKDLSVGPPLPASDLAALASEGSVLVAASAGFENAHEAEALGGSFFSHHLTAGLLGAADRTGDGSVTVQEVFDYARERTVRDSARFAPVPQHPSFAIDLRGRQDIVLSQLAAGDNSLELVQRHGPLEVIRLSSGDLVAESAPGERRARLVLPAGHYLIRRLHEGHIYSKEVMLPAGGTVTLEEGELQKTDDVTLAMKGGADSQAPVSRSSSYSAGTWEIQLAAGVSTGPTYSGGTTSVVGPDDLSSLERSFELSYSFGFAITDRLTWSLPLPAFSYRIGEEGQFELIPRVGLNEAGYSSTQGFLGQVDAGLAVRGWTSADQSVIGSVAAWNGFAWRTEDYDQTESHQRSWGVSVHAGYGWTIRNTVSLYAGASFTHSVIPANEGTGRTEVLRANILQIGSVLSLGYRVLPLVQVHLCPTFSLDGWASWAIDLDGTAVYDRYLAGFTWQF